MFNYELGGGLYVIRRDIACFFEFRVREEGGVGIVVFFFVFLVRVVVSILGYGWISGLGWWMVRLVYDGKCLFVKIIGF